MRQEVNLIGWLTKEELLQHLLTISRMGGDMFTLESLAVLWGIDQEFSRACPEQRVRTLVVSQR